MTVSEDLSWRDQVKDKSFEDIKWLDEPKAFYLGVDCSADSLTIGNLAVFMLAKRLLNAGWKTILLVGGATSLIGDPGGKESERELKSRDEINQNVDKIKTQVSQLFTGKDFTLVNNYDWFKDVGYLEFLREVGKHYSVSELLQRDFVNARLGASGSGISYAEFSYSLIQGYDYWQLFKQHQVVLQIGGSDQWGNMLSGVPLIRKKEGREVHALSMPLVINKSTGKKFGKSEAGAVWLDAAKTSVYQFYQFWLNVDDEGVDSYLKIYTELDKPAIEAVIAEFQADKGQRQAQKTLAYEVTKLVHGEKRADDIRHVSDIIFGGGDYKSLSAEDFSILKNELPVVKAVVGDSIVDVVVKGGLADSKGQAKHFLNDSALYINDSQFSAGQLELQSKDVIDGHILIRRGKNQQMIVAVD